MKATHRIGRLAVIELTVTPPSPPALSNKEWENREKEYKRRIASLEGKLNRVRKDRGSKNVSPEVLLPSAQYSGSPPGAPKKGKRKTTAPLTEGKASPDTYVGRNDSSL